MPGSLRPNECGCVEIFFSTPELVQRFCQVLDDTDLLVLSQLSRALNKLALYTFFSFHGMTLSQISSGIFSLSSLSLPGFRLAIFLPSLKVTKLSCTFDAATAQSDIKSLQYVLSRLPPISDLSITAYTATEEHIARSFSQSLHGTFASLLFTLDPYQNFLILHPSLFSVSWHHCVIHAKPLRFPGCMDSLWMLAFTPFTPLVLLALGLVGLSDIIFSLLSDPLARTFQDERILNDIENLGISSRAVRIISRMPPSNHLSSEKWTLVTFNESLMTTLRIAYISFRDDEKWHSILSCIRLPRLEDLFIGPDAHISLNTFISFVNRHPTIRVLGVSQDSISYASDAHNPGITQSISLNGLNNLLVLHASSMFIHLLFGLNPIPLPKLRAIHIGPRMQGDHRFWHRIGSYCKKPFDFTALESALTTVRECGWQVEELALTLPGGSVAGKWLQSSAVAGMFALHIQELNIATERGIPLHSSVVPLLVNWIGGIFMMTKLRKVSLQCEAIVAPSEREKFTQRISEVAGAEDVVVDFVGATYPSGYF